MGLGEASTSLIESADVDAKVLKYKKLWRQAGRPGPGHKYSDYPKLIRNRRLRMAAGAGAVVAGAAGYHAWKKRKKKQNEDIEEQELTEKKKKNRLATAGKVTAKKAVRTAAFGSEAGEAPGFFGGLGHAAGAAVGVAGVKAALKKKNRKKIVSAIKKVHGRINPKHLRYAKDVGKGAAVAGGALAAGHLARKAYRNLRGPQKKKQR